MALDRAPGAAVWRGGGVEFRPAGDGWSLVGGVAAWRYDPGASRLSPPCLLLAFAGAGEGGEQVRGFVTL